MCGLLSLSGDFTSSTVTQIIAVKGYYTLYRHWTSVLDGPVVGWTCVPFTASHGLPPNSDVEVFEPPTVSISGGAFTKTDIGSEADACVWAGVAGGLSEAKNGR